MIRPLLAAVAMALTTPATQAETLALTYVCERGVEIPAVYVHADGSPGVVVLSVEGRMINLEATGEAASGVRYRFASDKSGYVWWTHQDTADLSWFDVPLSEEVTLYHGCTVKP